MDNNISNFFSNSVNKNLSVQIAVCQHLTGLAMPNSDPGDRLPGSQTQYYVILSVYLCLYSNLLMILHLDDYSGHQNNKEYILTKKQDWYVSLVIF